MSSFLVLYTRYTSRLHGCPRTGSTQTLLQDPNLFCIKDDLWGSDLYPRFTLFNGATRADFDSLQDICPDLDGTIIFRFTDDQIPFVATISKVAAYNYCGFFYIDDIYNHPLIDKYEEEGMTFEDARDRAESELRPIQDGDFEDFMWGHQDYHTGTLCSVIKIQSSDKKVFILGFDTESG